MPTPTYIPLASNVLSSASISAVTFGSISQSYRDLILVCMVKTNSTTSAELTFNGSSNFYRRVTITGNGTTGAIYSASNTNAFTASVIATPNSTNWTQFTINIMDYSTTDKHKGILNRADGDTLATEMMLGSWGDTSAINSLTFSAGAAFTAGSTFALYGVIA